MIKFIQNFFLSIVLIVSLIVGGNIALSKVFSNGLNSISTTLIQSGPDSLVNSFFKGSSIEAAGVQKTGAQISQEARAQVISKARYQVLEGTTSPNKRYAIAMELPSPNSTSVQLQSKEPENYLVDLKANKIITTLHNCQYQPIGKQDLVVKWSTNSQLVLVAHERKWYPGELLVVSSDGAQTSILKQFVKDTRSHLAEYYDNIYQRRKDQLDFNLVGPNESFDFKNSLLQFPVIAYYKKENGFNSYTVLTYQVKKISNHIQVQLMNTKSIKAIY